METLLKSLPKYIEIKAISKYDKIVDYAFRTVFMQMDEWNTLDQTSLKNAAYLLDSILEKYWESLHIGHFTNNVPVVTRKIFAIANYLKIFCLLSESGKLTPARIDECRTTLDEAILLGCTQELYERSTIFQEQLTQYLDVLKSAFAEETTQLMILAPLTRLPNIDRNCDVTQLQCPSVERFRQECFEMRQPALLLNSFTHWPAVKKWRDLNYIQRVAGNRTVPIEIGTNYTTHNWSQQLVKMGDFLKRQFDSGCAMDKSRPAVEYLAQYELFDQIPALKADIRIPDYCTLSDGNSLSTNVDIKAWLGPKGTVSPLHYDPKHNLLCQVVGTKHIILSDTSASPFLYPHGTDLLNNTSQINPEHIDIERFPLVSRVRFLHLELQEGDCLYIPPRWWHYVRSNSASFSVSFWWE